jgi:hypothetical protein
MNKTIKISIRIIAVFGIAFIMSFIPDLFIEQFGYWLCEGYGNYNEKIKHCMYGGGGYHNAIYHWGYRHWIWFLMGLSLFIIQVIDVINLINKED